MERMPLPVVCGDNGHPCDQITRGLEAALPGRFAIAPVGALDTDALDGAALLVVAKSNAPYANNGTPWLGAEDSERVRGFVSSGGGLLVLHAGTVGNPPGTAMRLLVGGAFHHHAEICDVSLEPVTGHPLAQGLEPTTVWDEHYIVDTDAGIEVFLHSRSPEGVQPAGWTRTTGQGRVCVLTPGHTQAAWADPVFQELLKQGVAWLLGGA